MEFALIIKFILIAMMLFSAISYLFQRSGNKQSLQYAIDHHQAIRQLDEAEYLLLKPYLDDKNKVKPYKYQSTLVSQDVTVITGPCVRHSLSTNGAESSYYFVIGDIEVFLPYGMESYTVSDNVAEVVFTQRYAFVVNLNGFSLADAKADREGEVLRSEQWAQGSRGQFKTVTDEDIDRIDEEHSNAEIRSIISEVKNKRCEIVEQREETPLEANRKNPQNLGLITAVSLVLATIMALIYETDDDFWAAVVSGLFVVIAIIFYFHKPKRATDKVNRVRGTIEAKDIDNKTLVVGDSLALTYPKHWQAILPEKTTREADLDITVVEKTLLRYGNSLSLSKEIEQYGPPKFWRRNCFIFIIALILSWVIYLFSSSLKDDAIFTYRLFNGKTTELNINDRETLQQSSIRLGDRINVSLSGASCDASLSYGCEKVFITDGAIDVSKVMTPLPEWAEKSSTDSLVTTKRDREIETLELYSNLSINYGNNRSYYGNKLEKYTKLLNIEYLAQVTDEACTSNNTNCSRLKEIFTILLTDEKDNQFATWPEVVAYAKTQKNLTAIIYSSTASEIVNLFTRLSEKEVSERQRALIAELKLKQQEPASIGIILSNDYNADVTVAGINSNKNYQGMSYYLGIAAGLGQTKLTGLVTKVSYHNDGSIASISINPNARYQMNDNQLIPAAVMTFIAFSIMLIIAILQLLIMLNKMRVNDSRLRRIKNDYAHIIL